MKTSTLINRGLRYHARMHLAVWAGCVVATAVAGGALIVGDSVRGSLKELAVARLGGVDHALVSPRFVRARLAAEAGSVGTAFRAAPLIRLPGSVTAEGTGNRVGQVSVIGADDGFWLMMGASSPPAPIGEDDCRINAPLAAELGVKVGDRIVLTVEEPADIPREAIFGQKDFEHTVRQIPLVVREVLPADAASAGAGRFSLDSGQGVPRNVILPLASLQDRLGRKGKANAILVSGQLAPQSIAAMDPRETVGKSVAELSAERLQDILRIQARPEDLGLKLRYDKARGYLAVETPQMILDPAAEDALRATAAEMGLPVVPVLTHLANLMTVGPRSIPYSTVTATDAGDPRAGLTLLDGRKAPALGDGDLLLNEWAADDLAAKPGDTLSMAFFVEDDRGRLSEARRDFTVRGVVRMDPAAADPGWAPSYPGITDKSTLGDWNPPFPFDSARINRRETPERSKQRLDDKYWAKHKTAPKAFVSLSAGQSLWAGRFGRLTQLRIVADEDRAKEFTRRINVKLPAEKTGLAFRPVRAEALAASAGATDFGGLFIGFSMFLIVSAALLIGLMFRLGVEQRTGELGLLSAVGFTPGRIRRMLMREASVPAIAGGLVGMYVAMGYAWLMLAGLRTWWVGAVGTSALRLHYEPVTLLIAALSGPLIALISVRLALRSLRHASTLQLLSGPEALAPVSAGPPRIARWTAIIAAAAAAVMFASSFALSGEGRAGMFFGAGAAALTALLAAFRVTLAEGPSAEPTAHRSLLRLAMRNAARRPTRSVLTAGLTAAAAFIIVAVSAFQHDPAADVLRKDSGAGGFSLIAETSLPLLHDLNTPAGRAELGFTKEDEAALAGVTVYGFRLRPGDDVSCKNLYRPQQPRILGVPHEFAERGGFRFAGFADAGADGWSALTPTGDAATPAVGDANTVQWILHKGLGDTLPVRTESGADRDLRIAATLGGSVFQSELLIADSAFAKLFPGISGRRFFLIETPPERTAEVAKLLNRRLADYGVVVQTTADRLASFAEIENTYLSTFRQLGGLGLLLGTAGLGAVMMRSVLERRGEMALLRAVGFTRSALAALVLWEAGLLLTVGLAAGTVAALPATLPSMLEGGHAVPWASLAGTLAAVWAVGMLSGAAAALSVMRAPLLSSLRAE
jgi:ABC-type antimicrobial peptide transport system permease subunit